MWNHGPRIAEVLRRTNVPFARFEGEDLANIFAYITYTSRARVENKIYLEPGSPAAGENLFRAKGCVSCHAIRGRGGRVGPDLGQSQLHRSGTEVASIMWNHGPRMWGTIGAIQMTAREMADIVAYLYFLQYFDVPGNVFRGEALFREKLCSECHTLGGKGTSTGPDLSRDPAINSPVEWCSAMWNHAPTIEKLFEERNLLWPKFQGDEMRDLVEYIRSQAPGGGAAPLAAQAKPSPPAGLVDEGKESYRKRDCGLCHKVRGVGGGSGDDLSQIGKKRNEDWIFKFLKDPQALISGANMPNFELSDKEARALAKYLSTLK